MNAMQYYIEHNSSRILLPEHNFEHNTEFFKNIAGKHDTSAEFIQAYMGDNW